MGYEPSDGARLGGKGLAVVSGGNIQIYGAIRTPTWTRLTSTALAGATQLQLESAAQWQAGDKIVIASTDYSQTIPWNANIPASLSFTAGRGSPEQSEERNVVSVSGNTVTIDSPLSYTHWGSGYEKAEVGLLTRNIVFTGDASSLNTSYGGHLMIRKADTGKIRGVEFTRFGQRGLLGRYPVHWHMLRNVAGQDLYIKDSSVHHVFQRCVVIHNSIGILVQNNVAFNTNGHCYFLEDGGERMNTFDHNLGVLARPVADEDTTQLLPTDSEPAVFWITNPNNTYTGNAAVGGRFGFWYSLPEVPTGLSAAEYTIDDPWVRPRMTPLGQFDNNVAHSNSRNGIHIDDFVRSDETTELGAFSPRQGPYTSTVQLWELSSVPAVFRHNIAYKNRQHGVWTRGGPIQFVDTVLLDNLIGFNGVPAPSILENSLVVGESDNIGVPYQSEARNRPDPWNTNMPIIGWETYDNGGPQYVKDVTFVNFTTNAVRPSGALSPLYCGPYLLQSRDRVVNVTLINSNAAFIPSCNYGAAEGPTSWAVQDIDGSLTGVKPGGWVVSNNPLLVFDGCQAKPEWNGSFCPLFPEGGYIQLFVNLGDPATLTASQYQGYYSSSDYSFPRATIYQLGTTSAWNTAGRYVGFGGLNYYQVMANMKPRKSYAIKFINGYTPPVLRLSMQSAAIYDWLYMAIPYPITAVPFTITYSTWGAEPTGTLTSVSSLSALTSRTQYFYDFMTNLLWIRLSNEYPSIEPLWIFNDHGGYDGFEIKVQASCTLCQATISTVPPPVGVAEDIFASDIQTCQVVNGVTSTGIGSGFMFLNPATKTVRYTVHHDLTLSTSAIHIKKGNAGSAGQTLMTLDTNDSPSRGGFIITRNMWELLLAGQLYFSVQSNQASEHIRGQLGCAGTCSLPPPKLATDPCSPLGTVMRLTNDQAPPGWPSWSDVSWSNPADNGFNTTVNWQSTEQAICGSSSIKLTYLHGVLQTWSGQDMVSVDTSVYKYLEFFVRAAPGYKPSITIGFRNDSDDIGQVFVGSQYLENFAIDEYVWSRARIPLSAFNFRGVQNYRVFQIIPGDWGQSVQVLYFDEIRFISQATEQTVQSVATVKPYGLVCGSTGSLTGATTVMATTGESSENSSSIITISWLLISLLFLY